ncbi:MAG: menaquinone biosynthesis protein [Proteobacteria bacterium]|nr:menaquinone biosynthesis protein [Pseudomonadota bacterium]
MLPRVGHIQFLNCLPLYYGLMKNGVLPDIELCKHTPTELSNRLLRGELDISPIPVIEYARHADDLLLLPRLTVSSDGKVLSILLVSKIPAEQLDGKPVALARTSATSQVLTKIILAEKYGVTPAYFESPPDLAQMFIEAEAALLIGDDALRVLVKPKKFYMYDLGEEWKTLTGEKMVYAVWGVRRTYAQQHRELVIKVYKAFISSMEQSQKQLDSIARDVAQWSPFPARFLKRYFEGLKFEFGEDYQRGCREFLKRAKAVGALDIVPELQFVEIA